MSVHPLVNVKDLSVTVWILPFEFTRLLLGTDQGSLISIGRAASEASYKSLASDTLNTTAPQTGPQRSMIPYFLKPDKKPDYEGSMQSTMQRGTYQVHHKRKTPQKTLRIAVVKKTELD